MSASDDLKIFLNILAQSKDGLNDPALIGNFSKAKAQLHMMSSMEEINRNNPLTNAPQSVQSTNSPQMGNTATSEPLGQNSGLNASGGQMEEQPTEQAVGKYDNL
jgi:hypothetical protein